MSLSFFLHRNQWNLLLAGALLGCLGCAKDMNAEFVPCPVRGRIFFTDGRELPGPVSIKFQSLGEKSVQSVGYADTDGVFSELTFVGFGGDGRSGAIPGTHQVFLELIVPRGEAAASLTPEEQAEWANNLKLFAPYGEQSKTPLEVTVAPDGEDIEIELDAPPDK